jgi:tetratricopeptide (TPR) repeat protein
MRLHSFLIAILVLVAQCASAGASQTSAHADESVALARPAPLSDQLGRVHHPVSTRSPLAQRYFDQGLALAYGFNHDAAEQSFREAARLDPNLAMAWWGIALVLGPNYNLPGDTTRGRRAYAAVVKAAALASNATPAEQSYIAALARRYGSDGQPTPQRDRAYADAMRALARRYPGDPDAQVLFAEALMDLHPWDLWSPDGSPKYDTPEIVATLEAVLKSHPDHIGANHYYIHAIEASRHPERAMASADRLGSLAPAAGHLVHMPSHIYIRTGRFGQSAEANRKAVKADEVFLLQTGQTGWYPLMYYTHNLHFLAYSLMAEGAGTQALRTARKLQTKIPLEEVPAMPQMEYLTPFTYLVMARFGHWDEILAVPKPPVELSFTQALWHYARGMAFAAKHRLNEAKKEQASLESLAAATPPDRIIDVVTPARTVLKLACATLAAEIAARQGNGRQAATYYRQAVALQDSLPYEEPPVWYYSARESLGRQLIALGDFAGAQTVFAQDLARNPDNPLSVQGLALCLAARSKQQAASRQHKRFRRLWAAADVKPESMQPAADANPATGRDLSEASHNAMY